MHNLKQSPQARKAEDKPKDFAYIPHDVLKRPLIRHKGDSNETLLWPGEYRVFNVLLGVARITRSDVYDHQEAWAVGGQHIERQRSAQNNYLGKLEEGIKKRKFFYYAKKRGINGVRFESLPEPPARTNSGLVVKPGPAIRAAGKQAYRGAKRELKQIPIESVTVHIGYAQIFRQARLWKHSYRQVIDAALQRLCQPIGDWPPLIREYQHGKRLQIVIDGAWLPSDHIVQVPFELPTTATALALFLYLRGLSYSLELPRHPFKYTDFKWLCGVLGIKWDGERDATRKFDAAYKAVNEYLGRVQTRTSVKLLAAYDLTERINRGRVEMHFSTLNAAQLAAYYSEEAEDAHQNTDKGAPERKSAAKKVRQSVII
jgi:hypothetical protein